jgi:hypothetical protein
MEVVMIEDRPRQAAEFATRAGRLLVKLGKYVSDKSLFKIVNKPLLA